MEQYAAYDDNGIWTTGETPEAALAKFAEIGRLDAEEMAQTGLSTARMTERLAAKVDVEGYDCNHPAYSWRVLPDGRLDLEYILLAAADVAKIANTTANTVHQWAKRYPEFRALASETSAGLIWHEADVIDWLKRTGRLAE